jgi:hypothetical protein
MSIAVSVSGQSALPTHPKNVDLPAGDLRFDRLLHLIAEQTGIKFSVNTQKFRPSRMVHVRKGVQSVDELLSIIRKSTGISYTVVGDHIIFIDQPLAPVIVKKRASSDPAVDPDPAADSQIVTGLPPASAVLRVFMPLYRANVDSSKHFLPIGVRMDSVKMLVPAGQKAVTDRSRSPHPRRTGPAGFLADIGLAADETFYIDPSLRLGWPFLYGIVQWSTNFNVSGLRYGIGGSLELTNKWRLGLLATTGAYSKTYVDEIFGSLPVPMTLKSTLQKIGFLAETRIGGSLRLQFGPVLNLLSTKYYNVLGVPTPLFLSEADVNSQFHFIKPPYTLKDTYSPISAENTRIWVGFQISLFYSMNFRRVR